MRILTGNDLRTGAVVWWDGEGWSVHIDDAVDVADTADLIAAREEAARRVNVPYTIEAGREGQGVRPSHIKERVRALGPTVRPDLTRRPRDPEALDWIL